MKKGSHFFIQEFAELEFFHGGVGLIDAEKILLEEGYQPIHFPHQFNFSIKAKIERLIYLIRTITGIPKGSTLVFIFPLYAWLDRILVKWLQLRKNVRLICYIADINGLKAGNSNLLEEEKKYLRQFSSFILHNEAMKQWLDEVVPGNHSASLEFFDFLGKPVEKERKKSNSIVFAGNLEKSGFLSKLQSLTLQFNLYGPGINDAMKNQHNVSYKGTSEPHLLPDLLEGSFGLVWDGESIEGPEGSLGYYMQYISHHKLSLYILSGLPIITACFSASASLVKKYGIGFCVSDLKDIPGQIDQLTESDYQEMIKNMRPLAKKISSGGSLLEALQKL